MDSTYIRNRFEDIEDQLSIINTKISYLIKLLKQNGFKDYEREAARKANLAWAEEMAKVLNAKLEEDIRKSQDNSKANE